MLCMVQLSAIPNVLIAIIILLMYFNTSIGLMGNNVAEIQSPGPTGMELSCNRLNFHQHYCQSIFAIMCFTAFMHSST